MTSEYSSLVSNADRSRGMNNIGIETSGVEDVLLQLGSDGYVLE